MTYKAEIRAGPLRIALIEIVIKQRRLREVTGRLLDLNIDQLGSEVFIEYRSLETRLIKIVGVEILLFHIFIDKIGVLIGLMVKILGIIVLVKILIFRVRWTKILSVVLVEIIVLVEIGSIIWFLGILILGFLAVFHFSIGEILHNARLLETSLIFRKLLEIFLVWILIFVVLVILVLIFLILTLILILILILHKVIFLEIGFVLMLLVHFFGRFAHFAGRGHLVLFVFFFFPRLGLHRRIDLFDGQNNGGIETIIQKIVF